MDGSDRNDDSIIKICEWKFLIFDGLLKFAF
jgi:hypothetical protein